VIGNDKKVYVLDSRGKVAIDGKVLGLSAKVL
jgi:hypothetical protein